MERCPRIEPPMRCHEHTSADADTAPSAAVKRSPKFQGGAADSTTVAAWETELGSGQWCMAAGGGASEH
ncbi:hypothetical protein E2562_004682 [Oryza meyeriana var. granulata]|uniref:Uncharacterized protein n=1 Tax=Oryza meyeriana var. granulata TaxID=110450 RepID=A0A6G1DE10_9ORYZ|nr:hypothetical protein E2562_004682 [Oryza meyeriana var. granulata]